MNTNSITSITVALVLITNWTGVTFNNKELGYVATNHILTVDYQGGTNQFTLKTVASERAVWRQAQPMQGIAITNNYWWPPGIFTPTTNNIIQLNNVLAK
jgi:hypothetical protein